MLIETNWLNIMVDRGENKGYVIQADQVRFGNRTPDHLGILFIGGDILFHGATAHRGLRSFRCRGFTITLGHIALGRTPLDEWSARRRDRYLHNTHKRRTSMPPAGLEPAIPASERPQIHALDRAATGIGTVHGDANMNSSVDENGYILRLAWELPAFLVDEKGYDFKSFQSEWTKTDIPNGIGGNLKSVRTWDGTNTPLFQEQKPTRLTRPILQFSSASLTRKDGFMTVIP